MPSIADLGTQRAVPIFRDGTEFFSILPMNALRLSFSCFLSSLNACLTV